MPRVTLDWDENTSQNQVSSIRHADSDMPTAEDGGPPALEVNSGSTTTYVDAQEDAGGPPAWLVEAIAGSTSGDTAGTTGEDAGPAPT